MASPSRERIALVVFFLLIILGFSGLVSYLMIGHSWNVPATHIDDATGSMNGYTTIIYEGVVEEASIISNKNKDATANTEDVDTNTPDPDSNIELENATQKNDEILRDTEPIDDSVVPRMEQSNPSDQNKDDISATANDTDTKEDKSSTNPTDDQANTNMPKKEKVSIKQVKDSYLEKQAETISVDLSNLAYYHEGIIVEKNNRRYGIYSIRSTDSQVRNEQMKLYFKRHDVDSILVVTENKKLIANPEGIDIVISKKDEDLFVMGETKEGTFYVDSPLVGSVGVVIISPSNVVSAKVVNSL